MASGKSDVLKGRVKEAAGALTGDKKLQREGKIDQAVGKTKDFIEKAVEKVKDVGRLARCHGPRRALRLGSRGILSFPSIAIRTRCAAQAVKPTFPR